MHTSSVRKSIRLTNQNGNDRDRMVISIGQKIIQIILKKLFKVLFILKNITSMKKSSLKIYRKSKI
jgi:hypothetical protein